MHQDICHVRKPLHVRECACLLSAHLHTLKCKEQHDLYLELVFDRPNPPADT